MSDIDPNILIDISTKIASIDERTKALQDADKNAQANADHRHRNVMAAIENFVPRREIEHMIGTTRTYAETLAQQTKAHCDSNREAVIARVEAVEGGLETITENSTWLKRAFIGAAITAVIGLGAYLWQILFVVKAVSGH